MSLRLKVYLVVVWVAALVLMAVFLPPDLPRLWIHYVAWTLVCYAAETMWFPTSAGGGTVSMASTSNLAAVLLWGPHAAMWIAAVSTLFANIFIQKKPVERGTFNAAQMAITMWVVGLVSVLLGVPWTGFQGAVAPQGQSAWVAILPAFLAMVATYVLVNRALVSTAIAWSSQRGYWQVMWSDLIIRERLFDDVAPFLLVPPVVVCFEAVRYVGLLLFYAPLRIIYESSLRYVELRNAQKMLIHSERMAAKGEMAAEIGHEISNYLAAISARAQMLTMELGKAEPDKIARHARIIMEQASNMAILTKGLMDFSHKEMKIVRVDVNDLVRRTADFVRPQNKFDQVEFALELGEGLPAITADPGQLQQVFINLFQNAAEAMIEKGTTEKRITVTTGWERAGETVLLRVSDNGPGMSRAILDKVFEPTFTTKPTGHGFGLSTCYRIAAAHRGRIWAESEVGRGATFALILPVGGQAGW